MSDILLGVIQDVLNGPEMEPALRPVLGNFHVEITRVLLVKFLFCPNYENKSVLSNMCWIIYLAPEVEMPLNWVWFFKVKDRVKNFSDLLCLLSFSLPQFPCFFLCFVVYVNFYMRQVYFDKYVFY